jgi:sugar phosphate isomerase/epimerase
MMSELTQGTPFMEPPLELGVCTWTFGSRPLGDIARRLVDLAFDGVELAGDLSRYSASEVGQILGHHDLKLFSLTPDNVDLAHPDTTVRQAALDYYLRLLDFAAAVGGAPLVSCHGYVGRVRPVTTMVEERTLLVEAVRYLARTAQARMLRLVFEVLNRYESHLINTAVEALDLVHDVAMDNVGIVLDAYHMNIEEPNPAEAIRQAGERLWLYHAADSNRQGIGRGHIEFGDQLRALQGIGYGGPIIIECTAPGPDPFQAIKDENSLSWLETYLWESREWLNGIYD